MSEDFLEIDAQTVWDEMCADMQIEPYAAPERFKRAYMSGVCAVRWMLADARKYIESSVPTAARDRLLARMGDVGA